MNSYNRKKFITRSLFGTAGFLLAPSLIHAQNPQQEKGPPLNIAEVKEFVGAAHKDMGKVQTMLAANPDLLNAVNNLGGWDWEDAVSAAGHVGYRELAFFLLEKGARMTLCVAAMLGKTEIVQASITAFPYMTQTVGPHKISLLRHAKAGGVESLAVVNYLNSIGIKE